MMQVVLQQIGRSSSTPVMAEFANEPPVIAFESEPDWVTVFPWPDDAPEIALEDIVTPEMLAVAGYQGIAAGRVFAKLGADTSYRLEVGKTGQRYVILSGYAGLRKPPFDAPRFKATHSAIVGIGIGPVGDFRTNIIKANGVGFLFLGGIEAYEFMTAEQDLVEFAIDMSIGTAGLITGALAANAIVGLLGLGTAPAWVPITVSAGTGFVMAGLFNYAVASTDLKSELETLIRRTHADNKTGLTPDYLDSIR